MLDAGTCEEGRHGVLVQPPCGVALVQQAPVQRVRRGGDAPLPQQSDRPRGCWRSRPRGPRARPRLIFDQQAAAVPQRGGGADHHLALAGAPSDGGGVAPVHEGVATVSWTVLRFTESWSPLLMSGRGSAGWYGRAWWEIRRGHKMTDTRIA